MNTIPAVSAELRKALKRSGRTQQSVREEAGLSRQTFANVIGGQADFKLSTLLALADRLGLELRLLPKLAGRGLAALEPPATVVESVVDRARKRVAGRGPGDAA